VQVSRRRREHFFAAFGKCFRLLFGPLKTQAGRHGDGINEIGVEAIEGHRFEFWFDCLKMRARVACGRRQIGIGAGEEARKVSTLVPAGRPDGSHRQVDDGLVASLKIDEQNLAWIDSLQQAGLADFRRSDDQDLGAALFGKSFGGAYDSHV